MAGYFIPLLGSKPDHKLSQKDVVALYKQAHAQIADQENPEDFARKTIFIFPGNPDHHPPIAPGGLREFLFSRKGGEGLAKLAGELGDAGYPALSLPTTRMNAFAKDPRIKKIAEDALATIRAALERGYNIAIAVRPFNSVPVPAASRQSDASYFAEPLFDGFEYSAWGGIERDPNPPLADYYTQELQALLADPTLNKGRLAPQTLAEPQTSSLLQAPENSLSTNPATLFSPTKAKTQAAPATSNALAEANQKLAHGMQEKDANLKNKDFIVCKGNLNGTFKVGFKDAAAADAFSQYLRENGFSNVTYYGASEKYPMNAQGIVMPKSGETAQGKDLYQYIVRFEAPTDALGYLSKNQVPDYQSLYEQVMGITPRPSP